MNPTDPGPIYIVHQTPVGRRESNFIAQVDLTPFDLAGQFEQVWLHDQSDGTYALACIPFMAYGLALGDMVRLSPHGMVVDLVQVGGRRVLRLLMAEDPDTDRLARTVQEVKDCVARSGLLSEWHGSRFIAVDVPSGARPDAVYAVMETIVAEGRGHWEWADVQTFVGVGTATPEDAL